MVKSYFVLAFRSLYKHAGYSLLNLFGLGIGIACFVVIVLYVHEERSYDRFHEKADRIYRVLDFRKVDGIGEESSSAPLPLAEAMRIDYPEQIETAVRFFNFQAPTLTLAYENPSGELRQYNEQRLFFADHDVLQVFDFALIQGNPATALVEPNTIILTTDMAEKYFGPENPMGQVLRFEGKHDFIVTGVLDQLPSNTHLKFDFLASFATLDDPTVLREGLRNGWIWNPCWTYVLLRENIRPDALEAQFPAFVVRHFPASRHDRVKLYLQPLTDIHLYSKLDYEMGPNSDIAYVYIFSTIALFILLISCINFVNLVTARSTRRAREIGMRKVLGGHRLQLIRQFLSESALTSLIALLFALPMIWLLLPVLNAFSGKHLAFHPIQEPGLLLGLVGLALGIGFISGLYPAFFLSSFRPAHALKGSAYRGRLQGGFFRKFLVVGQFTLSIILIIGTLGAAKQLDYLQERRLGFTPEQVVLLPTLRSPLLNQYATFKDALLQHRTVHALTTVEDVPGVRHQTGSYQPEGQTEEQQFPRLIVHDDFATTMGIEMAAGREFQAAFPTDADDAVIINEAMVRQLGWGSAQEALGKSIDDEVIVGVTKDFHFASLHRPIGPFVLQRVSDNPRSMAFSGRYIAVRISTEDIDETLAFIEQQWFLFTPNRPFDYLFLNDVLGTQYDAEATLSQVAGAFSMLSMLIACLGLFGLASFTAERRTKEIGIRKVMGASVSNLVLMLSSSFVKLVGLATLIAWPLAYVGLGLWLEDFAYRTSIGLWPFILASVLALGIAYLSVSYQAIKTALANPIESLRYE